MSPHLYRYRYMCQINTVTAKTQFGYVHVVGEFPSFFKIIDAKLLLSHPKNFLTSFLNLNRRYTRALQIQKKLFLHLNFFFLTFSYYSGFFKLLSLQSFLFNIFSSLLLWNVNHWSCFLFSLKQFLFKI